MILEDSEDIVVARNHPQIEGRHVEDGLMPTGRREDIKRILAALARVGRSAPSNASVRSPRAALKVHLNYSVI